MKKSFFKNLFSFQRGFIALITVLIILGIILIIGLGISFLSVEEASMGLQKSQSSQAYYLANLCAEEAIMKLRENSSYQGNETIPVGNNNCQIRPVQITGGKWVIEALGDFSSQIRKIRIVVTQINPRIIIQSWQEVADF